VKSQDFHLCPELFKKHHHLKLHLLSQLLCIANGMMDRSSRHGMYGMPLKKPVVNVMLLTCVELGGITSLIIYPKIELETKQI